jgi:hypothetical protein
LDTESGLQTLSRRLRSRPAWGVIALVLLFGALFAWSELRVRAVREELSETSASLSSLMAERSRLRKDNDRLSAELNQLGDSRRSSEVAGKGSASGATARLFVGAEGKSGMVVLNGLPPVPEEKRYQLWITRDGSDVTEKVASFAALKDRAVRVTIGAGSTPLRSMAVTVEPSTEVDAPTGEEVFAGAF